MNNKIKKYLIENKQVRLYLLSGKEIYEEIKTLNLSIKEKELFKIALNITSLINSLNAAKQRMSFTFSSENRDNKISTESFENNTITGTSKFSNTSQSFKKGRLQTITTLNAQYGGSHISYSLLESGDLYKDMENYYYKSEQTPTYFFPLSDSNNSENIVILVQPLPFTNKTTITKILEKINLVKNSMADFTVKEVEEALYFLFSDYVFLESTEIIYSCGCSKDMFLGIIFSLSQEEINNTISNNEEIEVVCSLCGEKYIFSSEDVLSYLR